MIFCKDNTNLWLIVFPNFRKTGKFAASSERPKTKSASATGGFRPWLPDQGRCPGSRWGLCPQTPIINSCYRARHEAVPSDISGWNRHCRSVVVVTSKWSKLSVWLSVLVCSAFWATFVQWIINVIIRPMLASLLAWYTGISRHLSRLYRRHVDLCIWTQRHACPITAPVTATISWLADKHAHLSKPAVSWWQVVITSYRTIARVH